VRGKGPDEPASSTAGVRPARETCQGAGARGSSRKAVLREGARGR